MPSFKRLKELKSVLSEFPGVKTYKELDILVEIGYHQEQGAPLTLKQLLELNIASPATVRRYIVHLVGAGLIRKSVSVRDHRSVVFELSDTTIQTMLGHLANILHAFMHMQDEMSRNDRERHDSAA
jgi:DNA-binding MarR family transcriptional regulator